MTRTGEHELLAGIMICCETYRELLQTELTAYGIELKEEQLLALLRHLDLVVEKNKLLNLTRIVKPQEAVERHVVDSLLLLPTIDNLVGTHRCSYVDVGTGAGFPGIPLGVARDWKGMLIDSVGKKAAAVNEFISCLGLDKRLQAHAVRAEDLARTNYASYDLVVARAVADLGVLVEYASPLLGQDGHLVVSKAKISEEELNRGDKTARLVGMKRVSRETFELPHNGGHREIIAFEKCHESMVKLPRRTGEAKKNPLAK